jgi:hypothetical protein
MLRGILLAGAATLVLSAPALAIGPASVPAPAPTTSASGCDGCASQDQNDTSSGNGQSQASPDGSGVTGPVGNPSKPEPAHTEVPSHASGAGPGGSPKS